MVSAYFCRLIQSARSVKGTQSSSLINPLKYMEFVVFQEKSIKFPPVIINESQIERVEKLSILGLSIRDLKWNDYVDKTVNKASKRICLLKQLKRFGLDAGDLKCFYVASIRLWSTRVFVGSN